MFGAILRSTPLALGGSALVHTFNVWFDPPFEVYYSVFLSTVALVVLIAHARETRRGTL